MNFRIPSRWLFASLLASGGFASVGQSQDKWTDSSGTRTVEAEFVALEGVQLKLKKTDGSEVVLPLFKLDEASRRLARRKASASGADEASAAGEASTSNRLPLAISPAPVPFREKLSLQEYFQLVESEYTKGNYLIEWDAIPVPYQGVIQDYFATAISKLDGPIIQEIEQLKTRWVNALKAKKELILNSPSLGWDSQTQEVAAKAYDPLVELLAALPPGEGFDPDAVKDVPLRDTMKLWIERLLPKLDSVVETLPGARESFFASRPAVANTRFIVINNDAAQAAVTKAGSPAVTTDWIRFQSQWVPKSYQKKIDEIYFANERLDKEDAEAFRQKIRQQITAASLAVGVLEASETQSDIDDVLRGVRGQTRGLLPALLSGGGAMPNNASGYPGSGYPGSGNPSSGYPANSGYPNSGYPISGYPGSSGDPADYPTK